MAINDKRDLKTMNKAKARIYQNVLATIEKCIQKSTIQFGDRHGNEVGNDEDMLDDFIKIQQQLFAAAEVCKTRLRPDSPKRVG